MISDTLDFALGILRPLRDNDAEVIARACQDPEIGRWTLLPHPYGIEHARAFVRSGAGEDHVWGIDVDGLVGVIGIRNTVPALPGPVTDVGYWVAPWARGRGIASTALTAVREELQRAGYQRLNWETVAGNEPSARVAVKAGFRIEGYRRQALVQRGRLVDAVVGGWTAAYDAPELVAGVWQLQPVGVGDVPPALQPMAAGALAVWVARTAVGGIDSGHVMAVRSPAGVHVVCIDAAPDAALAVSRFLTSEGHEVTDLPLPAGWL